MCGNPILANKALNPLNGTVIEPCRERNPLLGSKLCKAIILKSRFLEGPMSAASPHARPGVTGSEEWVP